VQKLFYLPEAHTDFVFAVMAEEFGLAGVILVIGLFVILVGRALGIGREAAKAGFEFQSYLASAIGIWLGLQAFVNVGVNMGVLPTKGLTLPLFSYAEAACWSARLARRAGRIPRDRGVGSRRRAARGAAAMTRRVAFIMAGGTGACSALATARVLRRRGFDVVWLGTRAGSRARSCRRRHTRQWLSVGGLRGKGVATLLAAPFRLVHAVLQAMRALRRHRPAVVLGAGGFASGPGGIASWLLRRPLVVHEQNAIAGMTNRVLARLADRVLEGFPAASDRGCAPCGSATPCVRRSPRSRRPSSAMPAARDARVCSSSAGARARRG
jgi:hypothetical protein